MSGDGQPNGFVVSVANNAGTAYVVADIEGLTVGQAVGVGFYANTRDPDDRTNYGAGSLTIERDGRQWVAVPVYLDGSMPAGDYAMDLFVDGEQVGSIGVRLTGPGTQPRSA